MDKMIRRINTFFQYKDLLYQLVARAVKLKYRRSVLGYLWSVLNPLFVMIIMTIVFSTMFERSIENYPVYLFTGRMLFEFFSTSTNQGMQSIIENAALLKKSYVPKYIFTFARVTSNLIDLIFSVGALIIIMLVTRSTMYWTFLLCPLVFVQIYIFCCGFSLILAALNVYFRDVQYIYHAMITAWLYLTPIFYPLSSLPEHLSSLILRFNPICIYITQFRDLVYSGFIPEAALFFQGWILAFISFIVGLIIFKKLQDNFILYI